MGRIGSAAPSRRVLVELRAIDKHFGGVRALDAVSISVEEGTVHAVIGENGAGKSTLGKIIAGAVQPDAGEIVVDGEAVSFRSPREALSAGIAAIAQELLVVPRLSVAENVFLGAEPRRGGWVKRGALRRRFDALAAEAGFSLPAERPAGSLRTAEQQQIEILRALARDARLIVMDEPSAALSEPDTVRLHEIIRSLTQAGKSVLLVSHFLREVLELADTVTILRDGKLVHTKPGLGGDRGHADPGHARPAARRRVSAEARAPDGRPGSPLGPGAERARRQRRVAGGSRGRDRRDRRSGRRGPERAGARDLRSGPPQGRRGRARRRLARRDGSAASACAAAWPCSPSRARTRVCCSAARCSRT